MAAVADEERDAAAVERPRVRYTLRPVTTRPARAEGAADPPAAPGAAADDPFIRPAAEDDDGYDPFSDRPPAPEPTYQEDPWR